MTKLSISSIFIFLGLIGLQNLTSASCQRHLMAIVEGPYAGRSVVLKNSDGTFSRPLKQGDILEVTYNSGINETIVIAVRFQNTTSGGHGDGSEDFSYPTVPVIIDGVLNQILIDEGYIERVKSVKYLGSINPAKFPAEYSSSPGNSWNKLLKAYFHKL